ncbi:MAG: GNAT family N-acetyltransferase [Candidatus Heimdallarchaeota archaeon]
MFEGEKVILRSVELSDLDDIMKNWNTLKLREFLSTPIPHSREEEEKWIRGTWEERRAGKGFQFAVDNKETKKFLGSVGLMGVDNVNRSAEVGIAIHAEENWGKGFGTDAMRVIIKVGFDYLNLHRIYLRVYDFNVRGIKSYTKIGFTEVGRHRQAHYVNGKYHDVVYMDLIRDEWLEKKKELGKEFQ